MDFRKKAPTFALLTDFGFDFAVASMKGVILQSLPQAHIIDIDHSLQKFSILSGAFILEKTITYFPADTIFICVVDPGVGSERELLCIEDGNRAFFGPDNGIFHGILKKNGIKTFRIKPDYFQNHSSTFHGRDIFTPAAVAYSNGNRAFLESIPAKDLITLADIDTKKLITYIDSFGNIKTNIASVHEKIPHYTSVIIRNTTYPIKSVQVFADVLPGTLICYKGSNDTLEIAISGGSAQKFLQCQVGDRIEIY